jgi:hypothetical protein
LGEGFGRPLEVAGRFALATVFAAGLFVFSLTILFAAGLDLGLTFALAFTLLFAIVVSSTTDSARSYPEIRVAVLSALVLRSSARLAS